MRSNLSQSPILDAVVEPPSMQDANRVALILDSSVGMREAFCCMLGELGIRAVAADASATLSPEIWRKKPGLIFADAELFARDNDALGLRSYLAKKEGVTAIACAQPDGLGLVFQALRRGADDYLIKPFDRAILKAKLTCLGFY